MGKTNGCPAGTFGGRGGAVVDGDEGSSSRHENDYSALAGICQGSLRHTSRARDARKEGGGAGCGET